MDGVDGEGRVMAMTDKQAEDFIRDNRDVFLDGVGLMTGRPQDNIYSSKVDGKIEQVRPANVEGQDFVALPVIGNTGSLEVKANGQFLAQANNDRPYTYLEPAGTLYFEVFQNWYPDRRHEMYQGWMYSIIDPETYTDIKRKWQLYWQRQRKHVETVTAERWGNFAMALLDGRQEPFACVAFQNMDALLKRLRELCPDPDGWGMDDILKQRPATDKAYWDTYMKYYDVATRSYHNITWSRTSGGMIEHCWHIPLKSLADVDGVKITMIGDDREPANEYRLACERASEKKIRYYGSAELIRSRLNALKDLATGRVYPEELQARREQFTKATGKPGQLLTADKLEQLRKMQDVHPIISNGKEVGAMWVEMYDDDGKQ